MAIFDFHITISGQELLESLHVKVDQLTQKVNRMSELGQQLLDRVTAIEDAGDAIITVLNAVRAELAAAVANGSMPEVQEVLDRLASQTDELAAAVVANTPAAE
jgi:hypothetical protein